MTPEPTIARYPDWTRRLAAYVAAHRNTSFEYGVHDCTVFANGAVEAITGVDLMARLGVSYQDERGAVTARGAHRDPVSVLRTLLPEIPVAQARQGDVAVVPTSLGPAFAVVGGSTVLTAAEHGLAFVPLTDAITAFRV